MGQHVGIDLGTSNSVISIHQLNSHILKNAENKEITPSVVFFKPDSLNFFEENEHIVGEKALNWQKQAPASCVYQIKRLIGHSYEDKEIQEIIAEKKLSYALSQKTDNQRVCASIPFNTNQYLDVTPEHISSLILKKIVQDAQSQLSAPIEGAVITVPAYFNDKQKHATMLAGNMAGLKVLRLLPEPTAAAISFGILDQASSLGHNIIVFDFGGGTLDISLLSVGGGNFIEQNKTGDMWLGGSDIDILLVNLITAKAFEEKQLSACFNDLINDNRLNLNPLQILKARLELKTQAEKAKIALSQKEKINVEIFDLFSTNDDASIDIDIVITRADLEKLIAPMVTHAIKLCQKVHEEINIRDEHVHKVLLVGGSSLIPLVKTEMVKAFPKSEVILHSQPMLAIAQGASILAKKLTQPDEKQDLGHVLHTSGHEYYLTLPNGEQHLILGKNIPLPARTQLTLGVISKKQSLMKLPFTNKIDGTFIDIGILWPTFEIEDDEHGCLPQLRLSFEISQDNMISTSIEQIDFNHPNDPILLGRKNFTRGNIDEFYYKEFESLLNEVCDKKDYYMSLDIKKRSKTLIHRIANVVDAKTQMVNDTIKMEIEAQLQLIRDILKNDVSPYTRGWYEKDYLEEIPTDDLNSEEKEILKSLKQKVRRYIDFCDMGNYVELMVLLDQIVETKKLYFSRFEDQINEQICDNPFKNCIDAGLGEDAIKLFMQAKDEEDPVKLKKIHKQMADLQIQAHSKLSHIEHGFSLT